MARAQQGKNWQEMPYELDEALQVLARSRSSRGQRGKRNGDTG